MTPTPIGSSTLVPDVLRACDAPRHGIAGVQRIAATSIPHLLQLLSETRRAWLEQALSDATGSGQPQRESLWQLLLRAANDRQACPALRGLATVTVLALRVDAGESVAAIGHAEQLRIMDLDSALPKLGARLYELVRLARMDLPPRHLDALGKELIDVLDQLEATAPTTAPARPESRPLSDKEVCDIFLGARDDQYLTSQQVRRLFGWTAKTTWERNKRVLRRLARPIPGHGRSYLWPWKGIVQFASNKGIRNLALADLPDEIRMTVAQQMHVARPEMSKDEAIHQGLRVG